MGEGVKKHSETKAGLQQQACSLKRENGGVCRKLHGIQHLRRKAKQFNCIMKCKIC
jgi:hypothetical protein